MKQNPKQVGSNLIDCKPQVGKCPLDCNQCYYNRPGAYYGDVHSQEIPTKEEAKGKIVRMNAAHDSNIDRDQVIAVASEYEDVFFNTAINNLKFPGPVVLTANPDETKRGFKAPYHVPDNLMFVRLRTSPANLFDVGKAAMDWTLSDILVVLTFMCYSNKEEMELVDKPIAMSDSCFEYGVTHKNKYWKPTRVFKEYAIKYIRQFIGSRMISMCGTLDSNLCKDCRLCEYYYWITKKRLSELK